MDFTVGVVSNSRKRMQKKVTRYDAIPNKIEPTRLYDAGGGGGRDTLTTEVMAEEQLQQYRRTLKSTVLEDDNVVQELRQTKIVDEYINIIVNVRREDFPSIEAEIPVRYTKSALQASWGQFLTDTRVALKVEFIDSILDRMEMAPVNRTLGLRDKGKSLWAYIPISQLSYPV